MQEFLAGPMGTFVMLIPIVLLFYFMIIRPQNKRLKDHQAAVSSIKRGDTVVLSSGMIGKVTRVEDAEIMVEVAQGMNVRVIKNMVSEVRNRAAIAANDKS